MRPRPETTDLDKNLRADGLSTLVAKAAAGLNEKDREVLELALLHDLDGGELASALGVRQNHAHALLSRARHQLEPETARDLHPNAELVLPGADGDDGGSGGAVASRPGPGGSTEPGRLGTPSDTPASAGTTTTSSSGTTTTSSSDTATVDPPPADPPKPPTQPIDPCQITICGDDPRCWTRETRRRSRRSCTEGRIGS